MKKYTQKKVIDFFSLEKGKQTQKKLVLKLEKGYSLDLRVINEKEKYHFTVFRDRLISKQDKSSNYMDLSEKMHKWLKIKKLLPINYIAKPNNNEVLDIDSLDLNISNDVNINKKEYLTLNTKDLNNDFFKIKIRKDRIILQTESGQIERAYTRNDLLRVIISYVVKLVGKRKEDKIFHINNFINIATKKGQLQKLNVKEDKEKVSINEKGGEAKGEGGFIDKKLINNSFVLCDLDQLTFNTTKFKLWLNKIIIKEELAIITFE